MRGNLAPAWSLELRPVRKAHDEGRSELGRETPLDYVPIRVELGCDPFGVRS
jgi:hypothetical protein